VATHAEIFTPQYTEFSGPGSTLGFSKPYREFLEDFLNSKPIDNRSGGIESVLDLGCGDMTVMSATDLQGALYFGVDVIEERVQRNQDRFPRFHFECRDIQTWTYPRTDLIVCKDVIQHWSTYEIREWLHHLQKQAFRYALITNCNYGPEVNTDITTGGWRPIDLTAHPFLVGNVVFRWNDKDVVLIEKT
jgi:SAM-dependent methyltransferase